MRVLGASLLIVSLGACARTEPPAGSDVPRREPALAKASPPPAPPTPPTAMPIASGPSEALSIDASPPEPSDPVLVDDAGKALAQNEDHPSSSSPFFEKQAKILFRAITEDNPEIALSFFFPLVAYEQVKDVKDPSRDYKLRLVANFKRDVHEYHQKIGADARFVGIDIPDKDARWMKPGSEGNRIGYFRVLRSALRYETKSGEKKSMEVTSFISVAWRVVSRPLARLQVSRFAFQARFASIPKRAKRGV